MYTKLPRSFYMRDTVLVARDLIGALLVREINGARMVGSITEVEAYCHDNDQASHAYKGKTQRNAAMFGPVGHCYIYFIYGTHFCMNVVSRSPDVQAGGVLIRGIKPLEGSEYMMRNRAVSTINNLTNGPGKITQALAITQQEYGIDLTQNNELYIARGTTTDVVKTTPRIGISHSRELLWRFVAE